MKKRKKFANFSRKRLIRINASDLFDRFRRNHHAMMIHKKSKLLQNWIRKLINRGKNRRSKIEIEDTGF